MKKRILSLALALMMVLSLFAGMPLAASAANFTLIWPVSWTQGTPPAWAANATEAEQAATIQAIYDEYDYQASIGFDMGTMNAGITAWGNMVNVQFENGDHTGNPWGQAGRRMGGIISPFAGTAFSIKADYSQYYGVVPLGNETQWTDTDGTVKTVQMLNNGQFINVDGTITRSNTVYAGSGAPAAVTTQFQKAYAESAAGVISGQRLSLGYAAGAVQTENGIYFQEFWSNETTGTAFIAGNADGAYVIANEMFDAWVANYKEGSSYFSKTGIPTSNAYTVDGVTYQDFEGGALVLADGKITGPVDNNTAFTAGFDYEDMVVVGNDYYYLVADSADLTAFNSGIAAESSSSTVTPDLSGAKDFTAPVAITVTAASGRSVDYTITVLSRKNASAADQAAAAEVNDMIAELPVQIFRNDLADIAAVIEAYEALTPAQKFLVDMAPVDALAERIAELEAGDPIRVTCVGDSITEGIGASNSAYSYPSQMQKLLGDGYTVTNCGVSGSNVMTDRGYIYKTTSRYTASMNSDPDIVIVALGTNDAGNGIWNTTQDDRWATLAPDQFEKDYRELIQGYLDLPSKPLVMVALPTQSWNADGSIDNRCKNNISGTMPIINKVAAELDVQVLDMFTWSEDLFSYFPDRLHPGDDGYTLLAEEYGKYVLAATEKIADISLDGINLDGEALPRFNEETRNYEVELRDINDLPQVEAVYTASENKTVQVVQATADNPTATVIVTSALGDRGAAYSITFVQGASGDVNADGAVNTADMLAIKSCILSGSATDAQLEAGDFNGSGSLDVSDIIALRALILKG